jgi:nucleoside-diphosphate-sugar epimerase
MDLSGSRHVIVGAGPVGTATARLLAERGAHVVVVTRSGSGPEHELIERHRGDATDADALGEISKGAAAVYNCANPAYHRWPIDWPPLADALLRATEAAGAVLAITGNLYPYGPVDGPLTEDLPDAATGNKGRVRASMWAQARAAHDAGRVRAVEVRASDFVGPRVASHLGDRVVPRILAGKGVRVLGSADQPHSWTYIPDVARMLVTAATDERAWGRLWHVPTNPARSQREAVHDLCRAAGVAPVQVATLPHVVLRGLGLVVPLMRELEETRYQFVRPFVLDSTAAVREFGLTPTPWDQVCAETIAGYRSDKAVVA